MTIDVIEQVVLVSGRIVHRGTGKPIDGIVTIAASQGPVITKLLDNGTFAVSADPNLFAKQIAAGSVPLSLIIHARSPQFTTGAVTEKVDVTAMPPFDVPEAAWKLPIDPTSAAANLARSIRGAVIGADPAVPPAPNVDAPPPVAGAKVTIAHAGAAIAPTTTDSDGRFAFEGVVVEAPATITVTKHPPFTPLTRQLLIDFTRGVHEEHLRLVSES
jgi:hypothetical protein